MEQVLFNDKDQVVVGKSVNQICWKLMKVELQNELNQKGNSWCHNKCLLKEETRIVQSDHKKMEEEKKLNWLIVEGMLLKKKKLDVAREDIFSLSLLHQEVTH